MPLRFCPICSNLLKTEPYHNTIHLSCSTCPYVYNNTSRKITFRTYYERKELTDRVQHNSILENKDATDINCPLCSHPRAYFVQLQTRSADEPMTIFYRCCKRGCSHTWREG